MTNPTSTLKGLDRRWIFLSIGLVVFVFIQFPYRPDLQPSEPSKGFYQTLESIPPGSTCYISADYGPSTVAELYPMHLGCVYQLLKKDVKIISGSTWETGPPMIDRAFNRAVDLLAEEGIRKEYGVDFVNLGFKAGQDVAIAKIGSSIPETFSKDYLGTPVDQLPIMAGVENFDQIALLCNISAGSPGARQWLQQVQTRYQVRMITGVTAVMAPDLYSFFQSKQIEGFLGGLVGAAEYEYLLDRPGTAMSGMLVQSLAHFLILGFILIGNGLYFWEHRIQRRKEE